MLSYTVEQKWDRLALATGDDGETMEYVVGGHVNFDDPSHILFRVQSVDSSKVHKKLKNLVRGKDVRLTLTSSRGNLIHTGYGAMVTCVAAVSVTSIVSGLYLLIGPSAAAMSSLGSLVGSASLVTGLVGTVLALGALL